MTLNFRDKKLAVFPNELSEIESTSLSMFTKYVLLRAPEYWWEVESSRRHHFPDERKKHGRVLHAKRALRVSMALCEVESIIDIDRDIVLSAALLHDICVWGEEDKPRSDKALPEHPALAANMIRMLYIEYGNEISYRLSLMIFYTFTGMRVKNFMPSSVTVERLALAIESHMGKWGNKEPIGKIANIVHIADLIASREYIKVIPLGCKIK